MHSSQMNTDLYKFNKYNSFQIKREIFMIFLVATFKGFKL